MDAGLLDVVKQRNKQVADGISRIIRELPISNDAKAASTSLGGAPASGSGRVDDRRQKGLQHSKSGQQLKSAANAAAGTKQGVEAEPDKSSAWTLVDVRPVLRQ